MGKVKTEEEGKDCMKNRLIDKAYLPKMKKKCVDKGGMKAILF